MAFFSITFYISAILLLTEHTQAKPALPLFPFGTLTPTSAPAGCDVPGDKLYLPGDVIFKAPNGCHEIICTEIGIQISDGDCSTPENSQTPPEPPTSESANTPPSPSTSKPKPPAPEY